MGGEKWAYGWGPQDDQDSIATIRHALDQGINWIDTAAVYGLGHAEEVVERALRGLSTRPYIFTKCGQVWDDNNRMASTIQNLQPASIRRECEGSLRRLKIERIDLYQFHWPDQTGAAIEDSWNAMIRLIEEGKVRAAGVSNFNVALLERCEKLRHVDSLQPPFSLIRRDVAAQEIPWCHRHGTGVIAYSPMQSGLLTDRFSPERMKQLPTDDWRTRSDDFRSPRLEHNLALRDALAPIAERHRVSISSVAIAWVLSWPGVSGAIVGARSPDQVDGWISAANVSLDESELDIIEAAIRQTGAGWGPTRPRS
jgi:aryl-alcohol dehydrogenase-like predicted oxidoreductase